MRFQRRDAGTSGSAASSTVSPFSSLVTPSLSPHPTSLSNDISTDTSSVSQSPTSTPWHYIQPPPDPPPNHVTAYITVATVIFGIGVIAGVIYLFRARYLKKRDALEAKMSPTERGRVYAARRERNTKSFTEKLGLGPMAAGQ